MDEHGIAQPVAFCMTEQDDAQTLSGMLADFLAAVQASGQTGGLVAFWWTTMRRSTRQSGARHQCCRDAIICCCRLFCMRSACGVRLRG